MKLLLVVLLLQHAVISARAGLITYVRNMTAQVDAHMEEGHEIRGNRGSRFEAMLGPDSYVRMRDEAAVVLESEALDRTILRILDGAVVIDTHKLDEEIPMHVLMGDLTAEVGKDGVYLFFSEPERLVVLEGEMRVENSGQTAKALLKKNQMLTRSGSGGGFERLQIEDRDQIEALPLVRWSRQRTAQLTPRPVFRRPRPGIGRRFRF